MNTEGQSHSFVFCFVVVLPQNDHTEYTKRQLNQPGIVRLCKARNYSSNQQTEFIQSMSFRIIKSETYIKEPS